MSSNMKTGITLPEWDSHWNTSKDPIFKHVRPWELFDIEVQNLGPPGPGPGWPSLGNPEVTLQLDFADQILSAMHYCGLPRFKSTKKSDALKGLLLQIQNHPKLKETTHQIEKLILTDNIITCAVQEYENRDELDEAMYMPVIKFDYFFRDLLKWKRIKNEGNDTARVCMTEDKKTDEALEAELQGVVRAFLISVCNLQYQTTEAKYEVVLYPTKDGYTKSRVVCKPGLDVRTTVKTHVENEASEKPNACSTATIMPIQVKKKYTLHDNEELECLKHCSEAINQHFCQLLAMIKGSLFAQDWTTAQIAGKENLRTKHAKVCTIFGMMVHDTKVQFTCLQLDTEHMENIIRRKKKDRVEFDDDCSLSSSQEASDGSSQEGSAKNSPEASESSSLKEASLLSSEYSLDSESRKFKGKLYISREPYDLLDISHVHMLKHHLDVLNIYKTMYV